MAGRLMLYLARVAERDEIIAFLDDLLDAASFDDYGPNGLQVAGTREVSVVVTGVSAHLELFGRAAALRAQLVLCHHGLFWNKQPATIDEHRRERLKALFAADMSLAAYHLPLDAHPEVGNNALICAALGLQLAEPFAETAGRPIGWIGRAHAPLARDELTGAPRAGCGREPLVFADGADAVRSVGVVSGGGAGALAEAAARGLDAMVSG